MASVVRDGRLNNMDITRKHILLTIGGWILFVAVICGVYFLMNNQTGNNDTLAKRYPIVQNLPYNNFLYEIGYHLDSSDKSGKSIIITITAINAMERRQAIQEIKTLGYNPIDYKIEFMNFESEIK